MRGPLTWPQPLQAEDGWHASVRAMSPQEENGFTSRTPRVSFNRAGRNARIVYGANIFAVVPPSEGSRLTSTLVPRPASVCTFLLHDFSPPGYPRRVFFALLQKATPPGSKCTVPAAPVSAPDTKIPVRNKQQSPCHYFPVKNINPAPWLRRRRAPP
jgi:hypothetical protein